MQFHSEAFSGCSQELGIGMRGLTHETNPHRLFHVPKIRIQDSIQQPTEKNLYELLEANLI